MAKEINTNASLPAGVRYNPELSDFSKVLYAEFYLRAGKRGFCYPTNGYLAELFSVSPRTVQRAIEQLKKANTIELIFTNEENSGRQIRQIHPLIKSKATYSHNSLPNRTKKSPSNGQIFRTRYDNYDG